MRDSYETAGQPLAAESRLKQRRLQHGSLRVRAAPSGGHSDGKLENLNWLNGAECYWDFSGEEWITDLAVYVRFTGQMSLRSHDEGHARTRPCPTSRERTLALRPLWPRNRTSSGSVRPARFEASAAKQAANGARSGRGLKTSAIPRTRLPCNIAEDVLTQSEFFGASSGHAPKAGCGSQHLCGSSFASMRPPESAE